MVESREELKGILDRINVEFDPDQTEKEREKEIEELEKELEEANEYLGLRRRGKNGRRKKRIFLGRTGKIRQIKKSLRGSAELNLLSRKKDKI